MPPDVCPAMWHKGRSKQEGNRSAIVFKRTRKSMRKCNCLLAPSTGLGVVNEGLDVRKWVLGTKGSLGTNISRVCLQVLLEGLKPRYPKKSIKFIPTEPRRVVTSLIYNWQQHGRPYPSRKSCVRLHPPTLPSLFSRILDLTRRAQKGWWRKPGLFCALCGAFQLDMDVVAQPS